MRDIVVRIVVPCTSNAGDFIVDRNVDRPVGNVSGNDAQFISSGRFRTERVGIEMKPGQLNVSSTVVRNRERNRATGRRV